MQVAIFPNEFTMDDIDTYAKLAKGALNGLYGSSVVRLNLDVLRNPGSFDVTGEEYLIKAFICILGGLIEAGGTSETEAFRYNRR